MPVAKTLEQHVRGRSFRARRHRELLAGSQLRAWPELAEIQDLYCNARNELEARRIAVEFERAVHDRRERGVSAVQVIYATCGPGNAQDGWFRRQDGTFDWE